MATLWQDLRFAARLLAKSPGFTAVAILTLALGIGANTAIFSLIDAVMLRSLPVRDPSSLALLEWHSRSEPKYQSYTSFDDCNNEGNGTYGCSFPYAFLRQAQAQAGTFSDLIGFSGSGQLDLSGNGPASFVHGEFVTGNFFHVLGVPAYLGRTLEASDDAPTAVPAVVLQYGFWKRAFGGSAAVIGRPIRLNGHPFVVVGVASPQFPYLSPGNPYELWIPFSTREELMPDWGDLHDAKNWWVVVLGRLRPGVSLRQAQSSVSLLFRNYMLYGDQPLANAQDDPSLRLLPAQTGLVGERDRLRTPLYTLMLAVAIVLLIACANVAGLLLARSAARRKEIAVRLALGGTRLRIARQLLTESVLISLSGGLLGVALAYGGVRAIVAMAASGPDNPFPFTVSPDWRLLAFAGGISLATGILFGLMPALRGTRVDLTSSIKESAGASAATEHGRRGWLSAGNALTVIQFALAVVVLAGAGLMVRTLRNLSTINPGFDSRNVLLFGINPTLAGYNEPRTRELYRDLRQRLAALPGVISASYASIAMLGGSSWGREVHVPGTPPQSRLLVSIVPAGPDFLATMRIPLLAGRTFTSSDYAVASAVTDALKAKTTPPAEPIPILVNQSFARTLQGGGDPIGTVFTIPEPKPGSLPDPQADNARKYVRWQVVGVTGDIKYGNLRREIAPVMFEPWTSGIAVFDLRTAGDPKAMITTVRGVVAGLDNTLPLFGVKTQTETLDERMAQERTIARLSSFFGGLALLLACIGVYGLLSYEVTRRTREIGIRTALGAQRGDVLRLVVGQGIALAALGAAFGALVAFDLTRYLKALLYGVSPSDPWTYGAAFLLLLLVALAACYLPARRASRVDPMVALRYE